MLYYTILFDNNTNYDCVRIILVMKTKTPYLVTSHNCGLHNNNVCVTKERLIKDIGLGYNNLYITMKNCVQGANMYVGRQVKDIRFD